MGTLNEEGLCYLYSIKKMKKVCPQCKRIDVLDDEGISDTCNMKTEIKKCRICK